MSKTVIPIFTLLLLFPGIAFAQGYMSATIGQSEIDAPGFDDPTSYSVSAGFKLNDYFAVELAYVDFGDAEDDIPPIWSIEADGYGFVLIGIWPITKKFEFCAKVGYMAWDVELNEAGFGTIGEDDGEDANYGLAAGYNFSDRFSMFIDYRRYEFDFGGETTDVDTAAIGLKFTL